MSGAQEAEDRLRALLAEPLALRSREELVGGGGVVSGGGESSGSLKERAMSLIGELVDLASRA